MKPDTYDTIIDTIKELCSYSGWFLLIAFIGICILIVVYVILAKGFDISLSIMFLIILDLVMSFMLIVFIFMIKKTKERFNVTYWRDYWMAFGHPVHISFDLSADKNELKEWLDENTPRLYRILEINFRSRVSDQTIVFKHKKDAVACKLKWS